MQSSKTSRTSARTSASPSNGRATRSRAIADGLAAWEAFETSLPDLVILDIIMPRMDGLELCRRLRTLSQTIPIVFLTSRDEEFDRVLGLELGADDYLCKPFSMRELVARVKVLFRRLSLLNERATTDARRSFSPSAIWFSICGATPPAGAIRRFR